MMSEASEKQIKGDHCFDSPTQVLNNKRIFRPIAKSTAILTSKTLNHYLVKRTKAYIWNFKIKSADQNSKNLKTLRSALRSSKNVQKLAFEYDSLMIFGFMGFMGTPTRKYQSSKSILQSFSRNIREHSSIKTISTNLPACNTDQEVAEIEAHFLQRGPKNLKKVNLDCCKHPEIPQNLGEGLKALPFLKNMTLDFNESEISDKGIENLTQDLKRVTSLQAIHLRFFKCPRVNGSGFQNFGQNLNSLTRLQTVHLDFSMRSRITEEGMSGIGLGMKTLPSLLHLKISIADCVETTDKGMLNLGQGLKDCISLKSLDLSFASLGGITSEGLSNLGLGLANLQTLQSLGIKLYMCDQISDIGPLETAFHGLTSLQNISLCFEYCPKLTDEGFHRLGLVLVTLVSLETMSLNWNKCEKLIGTGMHDLVKAFQSLCFLQTLNFSLFQCSELTETAIHGLSECLKALSSLKNLTLTLSDFTITSSGMQSLNQSWAHLPLEKITLEFCQNALNDGMIGDIGKSLNQIASLKNVVVDIRDGQNVTNVGKENFFQAFSGHACLRNIEFSL